MKEEATSRLDGDKVGWDDIVCTAASDLSVLIHTFQRYEYLQTVLEALRAQNVRPLEIIIADQTPALQRPNGFYDTFRDLPLRLIQLERPMHAAAQNISARSAKGRILLSMDDDIDFGPELLARHVEVMLEERVDVVFGAVATNVPLSARPSRNIERMDPVSFFIKNPACHWQGMVLSTCGANTSFKKAWFDRVGGYDEVIPRMADMELGYRLFRAGAKMFFSDKPVVNHRQAAHGGTRAVTKDLDYARLQARLYFHRKHFPGWMTHQYLVYEIINALLFRSSTTGRSDARNFKRPFFPIIQVMRLAHAWRDAGNLLARAEQQEE
jgi:GT2 family glycosyltransferase